MSIDGKEQIKLWKALQGVHEGVLVVACLAIVCPQAVSTSPAAGRMKKLPRAAL